MYYSIKFNIECYICTMIDSELYNSHYCSKNSLMFGSLMSENLLKSSKLFKFSVNCLMSCSCQYFLHSLSLCVEIYRCSNLVILTSVSIVSFNHFSLSKFRHESGSENCYVGPTTTRKRAICPNYFSTINRDCNFIS